MLLKIRTWNAKAKGKAQNQGATVSFAESEPLPLTPPDVHHHIGNTRRFKTKLSTWLHHNKDDSALKVCDGNWYYSRHLNMVLSGLPPPAQESSPWAVNWSTMVRR
jgi:hypothetical protein